MRKFHFLPFLLGKNETELLDGIEFLPTPYFLPSKQEDFIILFLLCLIFAQANTTEILGFCKGLFLFLPLNTWFPNLSRSDHLICNLFLSFRN